MTKVILTGCCTGKSYLDSLYSNVYDFDKHTLDYKWYRDGFEHLTDEEFKGQPNRVPKENWVEKYASDFSALIKTEKYDLITGIIDDEVIDKLKKENIKFTILLFNSNSNGVEDLIKSRSAQRGNTPKWVDDTWDYICRLYVTYKDREDLDIVVLNEPTSLKHYLKSTGFVLKKN